MELGSLTTRTDINVSVTYFEGPKVEVTTDIKEQYDFIISFYDGEILIDRATIQNNMWYENNRKYHTDWTITVEIKQTKELIHIDKLDLNEKRVLFEYGSKSMGDILAWFPYIDEFVKKHKCIPFVYCDKNVRKLFDKKHYSHINFVDTWGDYESIYKKYRISVSWDKSIGDGGFNETDYYKPDFDVNKTNPFHIPQQKIVTDILGLDYVEKKPKITFQKDRRNRKVFGKYVCIAVQSTAQAKYWNYPGGWDEVVRYIKTNLGYSVVCIDAESCWGKRNTFFNYIPKGVIDDTGYKTLKERASTIYNSEFFIGLGSGLSWLAWIVGKPVVMISSFSKPYTEFQSNLIRLYNDNNLSGYYNTGTLDRVDFHWNPIMKCQTQEEWSRMETITPQQVINAIKEINTWN
tara:strand:- start:110 stop:1324 length:1215 start_codon:yes stop_codon:yes gene_type:complete